MDNGVAVIDVFARVVVGGQRSATVRPDLAIDALEAAAWNRIRTGQVLDGLAHHGDEGVRLRRNYRWVSRQTR